MRVIGCSKFQPVANSWEGIPEIRKDLDETMKIKNADTAIYCLRVTKFNPVYMKKDITNFLIAFRTKNRNMRKLKRNGCSQHYRAFPIPENRTNYDQCHAVKDQ